MGSGGILDGVSESRVAVAMAWGRGMSAVGSRYQRTGEGYQTGKTQCVYSELSSLRNRAPMKIAIKNWEWPINPLTNPNPTSVYKSRTTPRS
jgi:hypothetical protein